MGGYGSGRPAIRPTVEGTASLVLDVNRLMAPVTRAPRQHGMAGIPEHRTVTLAPFAWRWTRAGEAEPWAELNIALTLGSDWGEAVLSYDIDHLTCPAGPQRQRVRLMTSPCRLGECAGGGSARQAPAAAPSSTCPMAGGGSCAGRLPAGLCLATRHLDRSRAWPRPPAVSQTGQRLLCLPPGDPRQAEADALAHL
jgi:hypothetical protein